MTLDDLDKSKRYMILFNQVPVRNLNGVLFNRRKTIEEIYYSEHSNEWYTDGGVFNFPVNPGSYDAIYTREDNPEYFL